MKVTPLSIPDVLLIEPLISKDLRGYFFESFRDDIFRKETSLNVSFVQDNHSKSSQGVLRGLHYQLAPYAQGKLIRVIHGEVFDVAVDLRQSSLTFGKYVSYVLSAENKKQIWIPEGFAHGFLTLSDSAEVLYKATNFYNPEYERCISWNDSFINIAWLEKLPFIISDKDLQAPPFHLSEVFP